ncbi:hypothetical protein O6H91_20G009100 [Diphasiastrum complanatum]|uniref:Uncharacterized protein n=2 Tax=Diphasiastrum complanatum TaxID=34168 RepID=A0ACC2ANT3_DIPCM|nr:hypothetical protein O6H91_20G009100 [Diphasiastrum complanatum]
MDGCEILRAARWTEFSFCSSAIGKSCKSMAKCLTFKLCEREIEAAMVVLSCLDWKPGAFQFITVMSNHSFGAPLARLFCLLSGLSLFLSVATAQSPIQADGQHLMRFLNSTLPNLSNYNFSGSPCSWMGVGCTGQNSWANIQSLQLEGRGLHGNIPEGSIGKLYALTWLILANNSLTGSIPDDIWNLPNVRHFNASQNQLSGQFPSQLNGMRQLQTLDLSYNKLNGTIPSSIGQLSSLQILNFSRNTLVGGIPVELSNCYKLLSVDMSANRLSGLIPPELSSLSRFKHLNLSSNFLEGNIPGEFGRWHYIQTLDLSGNSLSGPLLTLSQLRNLITLLVSDNQLNGTITSSIFHPPFLQILSLNNNGFIGPVPLPSNETSLSIVDFGNNKINGSVPPAFWTIPSLKIVKLQNNALTGSLPQRLGDGIVHLELNGNAFKGNLPDLMHGSWAHLEYLDLSSNKLKSLESQIRPGVSSLRYLNLAENLLTEWPFSQNATMQQLGYLNLSWCHLVGSISTQLGSLKQLVELDLSHNLLTGAIPTCLADLKSLSYLDLSYNNLSGSVPAGLSSLSSLRHMNASYNGLSGRLPDVPWGLGSFLGDQDLCGPPLIQNCQNAKSRYHLPAVVITGIVVGSALAVSGILAAIVICSRKTGIIHHPPKEEKYFSMSGPFSSEIEPSVWALGIRDPSTIPVAMLEKPLVNMTFENVLQATSSFNKETQIADGGYGPVFRGVLMGELHVAIKILAAKDTSNEAEAAAELETLSRLKHPNLVPLLGYCLVGIERVLLYSFMDNGDLHHRLHDLPDGMPNTEDWSQDTWEQSENEVAGELLSWTTRQKIALGTARALAFIHHGCNPPIVHGDVKSSNILLDSEYEPHLADCGLAALMPADGPLVGGSSGYAAPEYEQSGETTTKGDVYSFGVLLLELVTGKKAAGDSYQDGTHSGTLVSWVRALIREKRGKKALDPKLVDRSPISEMLETIRIAYLCTADLPSKRPTMQQVVGLLKDIKLKTTSY